MKATSLGEFLRLLVKESMNRLLTATALFSVVAVIALAVGMNLPKRWSASATLLVDESNIIKPLMEGRAVATGMVRQSAVITQVVLSKKILREILTFGGWLNPPPAPQPDPREEERMLSKLRERIKIDSPRDGLIRISYYDDDQHRSYKIANQLAEIYLREANAAKEGESREAFEVIDRQVKEYSDKIADAHDKVLAYDRGQEAPQPSAPEAPISAAAELASLRAEEATLTLQLSKTDPVKAAEAPDLRQERARVQDLSSQLARLVLTETEEHPDVKRARSELAAAQEELARAQKAAEERRSGTEAASALDDEGMVAARTRLERVRQRIAALGGTTLRGSASSPLAAEKMDLEMRGVGHDSKRSELLRRFEATRDIYQDLLKRRENARVSMMLDAERRGLSMRIQEPAEMPVIPSSLRLMHIILIGLIVSGLVPLAFLVVIVAFDGRMRTPEQVLRLARVPFLVRVGYSAPARDKTRQRMHRRMAALMFVGVVLLYGITFLIKIKTT